MTLMGENLKFSTEHVECNIVNAGFDLIQDILNGWLLLYEFYLSLALRKY
jgi:hypothetical protein